MRGEVRASCIAELGNIAGILPSMPSELPNFPFEAESPKSPMHFRKVLGLCSVARANGCDAAPHTDHVSRPAQGLDVCIEAIIIREPECRVSSPE